MANSPVGKTRCLRFSKIDLLPQGHGLPPLRRHSKARLILCQRKEDTMVEVVVQMGDDQDDDSSTPPHQVLPTIANPEKADQFATQYTKLMEKEGWELIEDQVQAAMPRGASAMTNAASSARPMPAGATTLGNTMAQPGSSPRMPTNQQHMSELPCPCVSPPSPNALAAARMLPPANSTRLIMGNYFGQSVASEPVQMDVTGSELTVAQQQEQQQLQHSQQQQQQSQRPQQLVALPTQNNGYAMNQQQQLQQYFQLPYQQEQQQQQRYLQLHQQQAQQQEQSQRPEQLLDAHQFVALADQNNGQAMSQQQQLQHYPQLQQQQQQQSQRQEHLLGALANQNISQAMNQRHQQQEQQQLQRYFQFNQQQQQEQQQLQHQLPLLQHQQQESQRPQQLLGAQPLVAQLPVHNNGQAMNHATQIQQFQFSGYSLLHRRQQHQQQQNILQREMMLPASMNMSMNVGSNFSGMNGVGLPASGGLQGVAMSNLSGLGQIPGMSNSMGGMPGPPNMDQLPGMSTMGAGGVANMMQQQLRPEMNLAPTAAAGPIVSKRRRGRPRTGAGNSPVRSPMDNLPMAGANQMHSASGVPLMGQAMARPGMQASQRPSAAGMGFPEVGSPVVAVGTDGQGDYLNLQQWNARQMSTVETLVWGRPSPQIGSEGLGSLAGLTSSGMDPQNGSLDGTLAAVVASGRGHVRMPMLAPQPEEVGTDDQGDYPDQQKLNPQQISTVGTLVGGGPSPQIGSEGLGSVAGLTSSEMDLQNGSVDGTLAAVVASGWDQDRTPMLAPQPEEGQPGQPPH